MPVEHRHVEIPAGNVRLAGDLDIPPGAKGIVVFAHGSGSSRLSPRNRLVAARLHEQGLATLLLDLLTASEEREDIGSRRHRFDVELLAGRLAAAVHWVAAQPDVPPALGLFGASTGAAAAIVTAARLANDVRAVVSRGGRPDLAGDDLGRVRAPTLLIVGGADEAVLELNRAAYRALRCERELAVVPGATHLFEEPGALEDVAERAASWFADSLRGAIPSAPADHGA